MKKPVVLSVLLLTATMTLTSCVKFEKTEEAETESTEVTVDSLPQTEADSSATVTPGTETSATAPDTLTTK